jgi:hypothetical protein
MRDSIQLRRISFRAYEIEHSGDLSRVGDAVSRLGGIVVKASPDYGEESAMFVVDLLPDVGRVAFIEALARAGVCL